MNVEVAVWAENVKNRKQSAILDAVTVVAIIVASLTFAIPVHSGYRVRVIRLGCDLACYRRLEKKKINIRFYIPAKSY